MKKLTIALCLIYSQAFSQTADTSKRAYHLFNPTPKNLMRGLETDRPDITESAYSVDAGHFQIESDIFKSVSNKTDGISTTQYFYNLANLKIGLTNSSDLQLVVANYVIEKIVDLNNIISRKAGFGQLTLRYKQNIWGNDAGKTALAVMPYITFPNGKFDATDAVEGGIIVPFALELNEIWGMGAQAQLDFLKTESGYEPQILNSITFARDFGQKWNAFVESYYTYQTQVKVFSLSMNGGLSYSISPNLKLDAGFNYGISKNTDKVYFAGFSFRY